MRRGLGLEEEVRRAVIDPLDALKLAGAEVLCDICLDVVGCERVEAAEVKLVGDNGCVLGFIGSGIFEAFVDLTGFLEND